MGEAHGATGYLARGGTLDPVCAIPSKDSIGILYSLVTLHLGFDFNADEYKIMGLAPYGDPARFRSFFETAVELREDGSIRIPALRLNATRADWEYYAATREFLRRHLGPERNADEPITDVHRDIAAALQECLNRSVQHICGTFARRTGLQRLAMAGSVALNCSANGHLAASGTFSDIYI